ncbi:MAG: translation initiation factor IF-3 [Rhodospirillaceae bacterium]|jgi:translation initiation factor IF-3|nr:translation initiation factor IF-3 [Rhodospirillaceae bacterium]MBT4218511.1 translation initiation factor IF-3 [Rhodospirillaceae bacterium]MBT4465042.1 translation initiation factor IF-3 [Rhodospirillaceae bacterium]MBT5014483.1 translation initiation factor IF-3 [Rhodospirillaceae bacterium]MBT6407080.1 translation initiation factor IF-3 [Rhodospirillaceae bacterium]
MNQPPVRKGPRVNDMIDAESVRVVGADGEMVGVISVAEGIELAFEAGLDLVEVSPNAEPPVCKVLDYGKYKYEEQKKRNEARKKQKVIEVKEIKMRPGIDVHDYEVKMRNARRFLDHEDKVKFTIRFRGREMAHQELGMDVLNRIRAELEDRVKVEQFPRMEGRLMIMIVAPK